MLQRKDGGWAYNEKVPSDPDSTLRALQFFRRYDFMIVMYFENDLHSLFLIRILLPEEYARIPLIDLRKCDIPEVAGIDHICVSALLRILYFLKVLKNKDSRTILNIIFGMLQFLHIGGQYEIILVGK